MVTKGDQVPLSDGTLAGLGPASSRVDFKSGECLFKVAAAADQVFVLLQGSVTIHCAIPGQTLQTDTIDQAGQLFGWEPLVFQNAARLTAATAASDGQALRLEVSALTTDETITAEGRLSRRYLLRAAQQGFQTYQKDLAALQDGQSKPLPLDALAAVLLRSSLSEAPRSWGTAVGLAGTALGASRAALYAAERGTGRTSVAAQWNGDPEASGADPRPLSIKETPWFWGRLEAQQQIVLRDAADLPEDAKPELSWLPEGNAACMLVPLHDGAGLRGALSLEFSSADSLSDACRRHALAQLTGLLALDLARRQEGRQAESLAHQDSLTGLTNGLLFQDRLQLALARARRADRSVALLYLDLDGFDPMNRELGSEIGDLLLKEIAGRLRQCARESDTVGRIGDDEFAIMLEDIDGAEAALQAAQRVMNALNQPIHVEDQSFYVGVSVGIALYPEHAVEGAALIHAGAEAMGRAKQMTGSTYAFFSPDKDDRSGYRMQVEAELRAALAARELLAYYQPIVDIKTGRIQGAEALARWPREDGTVLGPAYFLPIAEATGMVIPMSRMILRQACRETVNWNKLFHTRLTAAVNVSTRWLVDPQFLDTVENTLRDTGLPAHCLTLELTEEILSRDLEASERALAGLKALGVKLALDDFGTGHSSLAILERFTIDSIKIDRSFTSAIVTLDDDAPILRGTLALGRELGTSAVAEGVETEVQAGFLRRHGGALCQGYFFGKPMPSADFERRLTEQFGARAAPRHAGEGAKGL